MLSLLLLAALALPQGPSLASSAGALRQTSGNYPLFLPLIIKAPGQPPSAPLTFPVGPGGTDVIPHQIVRAQDDNIYIFANQQYSKLIRAYWTTGTGLPTSGVAFDGATQAADDSNIISLDAAYDGKTVIHVLANTTTGLLEDYPFDLATRTFRPALQLAADNPTPAGDYAGTSGVSATFDTQNGLHVAYWSNGDHITHQTYAYDAATNTLQPRGSAQQVDVDGHANHPALAISPADGSVTVAWVSEAISPARILARTLPQGGAWTGVQTVSAAPVWTSTNAGINIDQGPSLVIDAQGARHLTYIENFDRSGDYGHIHYVVDQGTGWVDLALNAYSHDPALALTGDGGLYIIGHGHPLNTACLDLNDMCLMQREPAGTWGGPALLADHPAGASFDTSPSVKWSVTGFNRPESIEFVFSSVAGGNYNEPTLYYGRLP